jgi:2-deoxy-D-gluconate 3-dehydrogenase
MDLQLKGSVAIVTGASRGLGRAIAEGYLAEGMSVVAAARTISDLAELADLAPEHVHVVPCDMTSSEQVASLVPAALERFGRVDVVVNNAGIAPAGDFASMSLDEWRRIFEVNVFAPVALTQSAAEHMKARGSGKIINVGSLSSLRGKPLLAAYSSSKGALLRLTEALSAEWARHGIQVTMIAPGGFATEAQQAVLDDPEMLARRVRKIPLGRMGDPHEVVALACYLASPLSGFVTGSCYTIDGGELAKL